jgi:uncharacterized protein (DUF58 family)
MRTHSVTAEDLHAAHPERAGQSAASDSSSQSTGSRRLTREGWMWLALIAFLWLIGVFKGINLISLLSTLMLAFVIVNVVASRRGLRYLRLRRWIDEPLFAHTPAWLAVEVENPSSRPAVGIRLEDFGPDRARAWYVGRMEGRECFRQSEEIRMPGRGAYMWEPLVARCGAPFGLVEARVSAGAPERRVVLPQLGQLHRGRFRQFLNVTVPSLGVTRGQWPSPRPDSQSELHGVRAFRNGDSPRRIHWPTSARSGELMVREFEDAPVDNLILILDAWRPQAPAGSRAAEAARTLEDAISLTATICWEWCRRTGDHLTLGLAGAHAEVTSGMTSRARGLAFLESLAIEQGDAAPDSVALLDRLSEMRLPKSAVVLISTRPGSFADALAATLHRPVTLIDVSQMVPHDFYEKPAHAS